jgi:hypothetical protein
LRKNQLETFIREKEKRTNIYRSIKNKLAFLDSRSSIKNALFGNVDVRDLNNDLSIPPQGDLSLYLKALRPAELDEHFERTDRYLTYQIHKTRKQISILEHIMAQPRFANRYERRIFETYFNPTDEIDKQIEDYLSKKSESKNNIRELLSFFKDRQESTNKLNETEAVILRELYTYINEKGYDIRNLTEEQRRDLFVQKDKIHQHVSIRKEFGLDTFYKERKYKNRKFREFLGKRYYSDMSSDYTDLESLPQNDRFALTHQSMPGYIKEMSGKDHKEAIRELQERRKKEETDMIETKERTMKKILSTNKRMKSIKKSKRTIPQQYAVRETY